MSWGAKSLLTASDESAGTCLTLFAKKTINYKFWVAENPKSIQKSGIFIMVHSQPRLSVRVYPLIFLLKMKNSF